jgi:uncharacterized protein YecE (DUF72 family)
MVEVYVGTSGWLYDWNLGSSLQWYVENSGLNAVELNASFYRFPYPSQVAGWAKRGGRLRWAVKVHRSITHVRRLKPEALDTWRRFHALFKPMDSLVDFYLFQMPPSFTRTDTNVERIRMFARSTSLGERFAVEFRHASWFDSETVDLLRELGVTAVSVDSPQVTWIVTSNGTVYLRLHGRSAWYAHDYSAEELEEVAERVAALEPQRIYAFFNNDHWMLENARAFKRILESRLA